MKCDDVQALLIDGPAELGMAERRAAMTHLDTCESCRDAQYAAGLLRAERGRQVPSPPSGALERAIAAATGEAARARGFERPAARKASGFWSGLMVGAGVAAAIAAAVTGLVVLRDAPLLEAPAATTPQVTLALHEPRDVSISVDAPAALSDAEIRVVLTGQITLAGFEQRELHWRTNLEAGANQLTLPVVATDVSGGQLLVEVQHGPRRKTFVVDVRGFEA